MMIEAGILAVIGTPFIPGWAELRPFIAECWLIVAIIGVLITPFFIQRSNYACGVVALAGVTIGFLSLLVVGINEETIGSFFRGTLISDHVAFLWKLLLLLFVAGIILLW